MLRCFLQLHIVTNGGSDITDVYLDWLVACRMISYDIIMSLLVSSFVPLIHTSDGVSD